MVRKILRLSVASVKMKSNGDPPDAAPSKSTKNNAIIANLKYPRSGAPNVASVLEVDLQSGQKKTFDASNFWASGLLKEEVQGETVLKIQVTDFDEVRKLDRFMAAFFGTVLGAGLGVVTGGIANPILGAVANLPVNAFKGSFAMKKSRLDVIGEAKVEIDLNEPLPKRLTLKLEAPKTIKKTYLAFKKPGSSKVVQKSRTLIKKGSINGEIELKIDQLEI